MHHPQKKGWLLIDAANLPFYLPLKRLVTISATHNIKVTRIQIVTANAGPTFCIPSGTTLETFETLEEFRSTLVEMPPQKTLVVVTNTTDTIKWLCGQCQRPIIAMTTRALIDPEEQDVQFVRLQTKLFESPPPVEE